MQHRHARLCCKSKLASSSHMAAHCGDTSCSRFPKDHPWVGPPCTAAHAGAREGWQQEEMSHATFPAAQTLFSYSVGTDDVLQELLPCHWRILAWTEPNQMTAPPPAGLFWLPLSHRGDFAAAAKIELKTGMETQLNTMSFWGQATKNPWAPKGAKFLNFPPKKIKKELCRFSCEAMGSLHPCMVEKEINSSRRHPETAWRGQSEASYSRSSFHSTAGEKEHIRDLNSLPPAKNCGLVLDLPCGNAHWVWQWGWSCTPKLNNTW